MMEETKADNLGIGSDLENWMSQLPETLKNVPFFRLAIPGSHDSLSYSISTSRRVSPDSPEVVQLLGRLFGGITRQVVYNWSITQHATLMEQLIGGIRYLDIRLAMEPGVENPVVVHGLYGEEVLGLLAQLESFLASHTDEVVVLDFQHFYSFHREDHERLLTSLHALFGQRLCPYWAGATSELTLRYLRARGHQVILVYRSDEGRGSTGVWPGETLPTPWPNTTSIPALLGILDRGLEARDIHCGHVAQCVLTPTTATVALRCGGLCSTLEWMLARPCNNAIIPWLRQQRPGSKHALNIAIADFVGRESSFAATVIQLNAKLLEQPSSNLPSPTVKA